MESLLVRPLQTLIIGSIEESPGRDPSAEWIPGPTGPGPAHQILLDRGFERILLDAAGPGTRDTPHGWEWDAGTC